MQVLQSKTLIMKCSKTRPAGSKKAPKGICTDRKTGTGKADDEEKVHFWWGGLWQHNLHRWEQGHGTGEVMIISDGGTAPSQAYVWWSAVWGESLTYGAERGKRRKETLPIAIDCAMECTKPKSFRTSENHCWSECDTSWSTGYFVRQSVLL